MPKRSAWARKLRHQLGAHDALGEPGVVLDVRRDHQLAAGPEPLDDEGLQVGARGVQRGRVPGRASADDDEVAYVGHVFLREAGRAVVAACAGATDSNVTVRLACSRPNPSAADSPLARAWPGFREREAQLRMAEAVAEVFEHGGHLVCEAGTGTGKSLAYLVPAAASGRRIVVSTATKALQGQLCTTTCRWPRRRSGRRSAVVLKGRSNYVCRLHAGQVEARLFDVRSPDALERLRPWLATTATGDRAELDFSPPPALWAELAVGPDRCRGRRCPLISTCFSEQARQRSRARPTSCWSTTPCSSPTSACGGPRTAGSRSCPTTTRWSSTRPTPSRTRPPSGSARGSASTDLIRLQRDVERACELDDAPVPHRALIDIERHWRALFAALGARRAPGACGRATPRAPAGGVRAACATLSPLAARLEGAGEECDLVSRRAPARRWRSTGASPPRTRSGRLVRARRPSGPGSARPRSTSARCCARRCGTRSAAPCCARRRWRAAAT